MNRGRFGPVAAVHVLLVSDGRVLLLQRANTGYEDGNYSVPAGHLEGGETVREAAIREAAEEAGIDLAEEALSFALVMHRMAETERIDFFFAVSEWSGTPENREPEKCSELTWVPAGSLPKNTVPYVRMGIEAFFAGERFVEFGWDGTAS